MKNNYWEEVPGFFDFQDIYDEAVASTPEGGTLVEVGTLFGRSALYMAQKIKESHKQLRFCVVDKWSLQADEHFLDVFFHEGAPFRELTKQYGGLFGVFAYYLEESGLSDYIEVLRMPSIRGARCFTPGGADFVFIDADHRFGPVLADITSWHHALKPGGTIAGHDYTDQWPGVKSAVDTFFRAGVEQRNNSWLVRGGYENPAAA